MAARGILLVLLLAVLPGTALDAASASDVVLAVPEDVLADYQAWLHGRDPLALADFTGPGTRRDVVEVALVQIALHRGGHGGRIAFLGVPTYARQQEELRLGHATCAGTGMWAQDLAPLHPQVASSPALLAEGEFAVGIYLRPGFVPAPQADPLAMVAGLSFVSTRSWSADWRVLTALRPRRLLDAPTWEAQVRLVAAGRADALLAPLQPGGHLVTGGAELVPLPGLLLVLPGERVFGVASTHPQGHACALALARGLPLLRAEGILGRAYQDAGFFPPAGSDWLRLAPLPPP